MRRTVNLDANRLTSPEGELTSLLAQLSGSFAHLPRVTEKNDPVTRSKKPTILLVDDEIQALQGISRLLHSQHYHFYTVCSAKDAIEILRREEVDVVVTDEKMPEMSGTELAAWIAQFQPQVKTIILTGHADMTTVIRAINRGRVFRFFTKPYNTFDLILAIYDAIETK